MESFYDAWLLRSEMVADAIKHGPRVARGRDLQWVETRQDAKAALMIAPETGFPTGGSLLMKAEIPVGWHTGLHIHGEEAIYVERGEGFLLLDSERYEFHTGTVLHVPHRSAHQLVNTGTEPAVYLSGLALPLESFIHMGCMEQREDAGPNDSKRLGGIPPQQSQYWPGDGRRVSLHQEQFTLDEGRGHGAVYTLMGHSGKDNGFHATAAAISSIFVENPRYKSHSHAHPEAYLYALKGRGYSEIDSQRYDWEQGDAVHVPPGMLLHQHFNPTDGETRELRFEFGIRYWVTEQWAGYITVDRHLHASPLDE